MQNYHCLPVLPPVVDCFTTRAKIRQGILTFFYRIQSNMSSSTSELYHYNKDSETLEFCQDLDKSDSLARFRDEFAIPKKKDVSNNKGWSTLNIFCE